MTNATIFRGIEVLGAEHPLIHIAYNKHVTELCFQATAYC